MTVDEAIAHLEYLAYELDFPDASKEALYQVKKAKFGYVIPLSFFESYQMMPSGELRYSEAMAWCREKLGPSLGEGRIRSGSPEKSLWGYFHLHWFFHRAEDAMLFKLSWIK